MHRSMGVKTLKTICTWTKSTSEECRAARSGPPSVEDAGDVPLEWVHAAFVDQINISAFWSKLSLIVRSAEKKPPRVVDRINVRARIPHV